MTWPAIIIGLVAIQRFAELVYSAHNAKGLLARGAVEIGRGHYALLVAVHVGWFIALFTSFGRDTPIQFGWLALFLLLQLGRAWVLLSLGPYWTTRLYHLDAVPVIRTGPYRFLRHPNYAVVAAEIAVLPLAFGLWRLALLFSLLNGAVLLWRVRVENSFLDRRPRGDPVSRSR